jgi:phosphoglycerate kinase
VLVLENVRRDKGEKANDPAFAKELAALADVFVQDSFDTCHREHASIIGVPKLLPSYGGLLLEEETRELSAALTPTRPSLAVIGGAKFSTKEAVLTTLVKSYDHVFVGGALADDFLKQAGHTVGKSLVSEAADADSLQKLLANKKLVLPVDSLVIPQSAVGSLDARASARVAAVDDVGDDEVILDHGPGTRTVLAGLAANAKTILWNGPLGNYEHGFIDTTDEFARAVAAAGAHSVVGGGDTVAAIENLGLLPRFSFVSTGGGAMLEYLAKGSLPGIAALER